jgi:DNA-binding GntR family transcriptional regulator
MASTTGEIMSTIGLARLSAQSSRNARSIALENIRQRIITLEFAPGSHLSENELAGQLGISRTPVRESLILLAEEQLVSIVPQVGTVVSPIVESEIATAQFVRESLELAALSESVQLAGPADIAVLNALVAQQRVADTAHDIENFFTLDEEFHYALMSISGHGAAWRTVGQAKAHLDRARRLSLTTTEQLTLLIEQHQSIVDSLERGDAGEAAAALRGHLRKVFDDIDDIRQKNPALFATPANLRRR